jgi:hypothetical protein
VVMNNTFRVKFDIGCKVAIDGDDSIDAWVIQVAFKSQDHATYEVSYWNNGDVKSAWIDEWRLSEVS